MRLGCIYLTLLVGALAVCEQTGVTATQTSTRNHKKPFLTNSGPDIRWGVPERLHSQARNINKEGPHTEKNGKASQQSPRKLSKKLAGVFRSESESPLDRYIVRLRNDAGINQDYVRSVIGDLKQNADNPNFPDFIVQDFREIHLALEGLSGTMSLQALQFLIDSEVVADYSLDTEVYVIEPTAEIKSVSSPELRTNRTRSSMRGLKTTEQVQPVNELLWNLDRVDDKVGLDQSYAYESAGSGVDIYVVDSGIRVTHTEFGGRAEHGKNFFGGKDTDCQGHGTHVAGTVVGSQVGISKSARVIAVKVFGCDAAASTATSNIVQGIEWAINDNKNNNRRGIINLSLGGQFNPMLNYAVETAVANGLVVIAAAGNDGSDACDISPASAWSAITIGSTDINDKFSSFSSRGGCVDVLAAGSSITSAWYTKDDDYATLSGTSMAVPAVSGIVARFLEAHPNASAEDARKALLCMASTDTISNVPPYTSEAFLFAPPSGIVYDPSQCTSAAEQACPGSPSCFQRGNCSAAGRCDCFCNWVGAACLTPVTVEEIASLSGEVERSTVGSPDNFGYSTGDFYFAITVDDSATSLSLTLCHPKTNFATAIWLLDSCFNTALVNENVVESNVYGGPCAGAQDKATSSRIQITDPAPGRYYILVEGVNEDGTFVLGWDIGGSIAAPSASPTSSAYPSPSNHNFFDAFKEDENSSSVGIYTGSIVSIFCGILVSLALTNRNT